MQTRKQIKTIKFKKLKTNQTIKCKKIILKLAFLNKTALNWIQTRKLVNRLNNKSVLKINQKWNKKENHKFKHIYKI